MATAIGYLRVSSAKQAKDGKDGFPRQRAAIRAYCSQKRIELLEEHEDAGVSGTVPLEGREGLSTALARCTELGADVLVVEKADRLGRDLIVSEMAVRAFAEAGVSIVTADTGQSLTDADNDPMMTPRISSAEALRALKRTGADTLAIVAEPAPYSVPPVDLWHWKLLLLPRGSEVGPAAKEAHADVVVRAVDPPSRP